MSRPTILLAAILFDVSRALAATPLEVIEKAMTADQRCIHKQSHLTFTRNDVVETTVTEINQPDQMHMIKDASGHKIEMYAVKSAAYWRLDSGSWHRASVTGKPLPQPPISPIKLLTGGMTDATELAQSTVAGVKARSFRSRIAWSSGTMSNEGKVTLIVRRADLLPLSMTFEGQCDRQSCQFEQKFSYRTNITIKAPE